jgi:thiosulfate/3-mercaptopyruvate sulfurtransferase
MQFRSSRPRPRHQPFNSQETRYFLHIPAHIRHRCVPSRAAMKRVHLSIARVLVRSTSVACSIALLSLVTGVANAQGARDALLVTPAWVATHMHDPNTILLHVGDPKVYTSAHLAGAQLMTLEDVSVSDRAAMPGMTMPPDKLTGPKNGLTLEMPTAEQLRSQFAKFGISDNTKIIVYSANQVLPPTTRVVFTLDYAGLGKNVVVMDGGLEAWTRENRPVTNVVPAESRPGRPAPLTLRPLVVDAGYVNAHAKTSGVSIVDARAAAFYNGDRGGQPGRLGHIPGAKSVPYTEVTNEDGTLKSNEQLAAIFAKAGVQPADTVVGYCHFGQQATAMLFAAKVLGHPVRLYDGSFNEWQTLKQFPVESSSAKKP